MELILMLLFYVLIGLVGLFFLFEIIKVIILTSACVIGLFLQLPDWIKGVIAIIVFILIVY